MNSSSKRLTLRIRSSSWNSPNSLTNVLTALWRLYTNWQAGWSPSWSMTSLRATLVTAVILSVYPPATVQYALTYYCNPRLLCLKPRWYVLMLVRKAGLESEESQITISITTFPFIALFRKKVPLMWDAISLFHCRSSLESYAFIFVR